MKAIKKPFKAELYVGKVKVTKGQEKKHIEQMTEEEVAYLKKQIRLFPHWKAKKSKHLKRKMVSLDLIEVEDMLLDRKAERFIVEYNETVLDSGEIDRRLLLRSDKPRMVKFKTRKKKVIEAEANLCIVISLDRFEIVTAYWNKVEDAHKTIQWSRYNNQLAIAK